MLHKTNSRYVSPRGTPFVIRISNSLFLNVQEGFNYPEIIEAHEDVLQERIDFRGGEGGGSVLKNQFQGGGGGAVLKNQFEGGGGGGSELSDQLLDPDVPTLASQDKLKVSPKGLPFVTCH